MTTFADTDIDTETAVFDAATTPEPDPSAPAAAPAAADADIPPAASPEPQENRGDLNAALREQREESKRLRAENARMLQILEGFTPKKEPEPEPEKPEVWDKPDDWLKSQIDPVTAQMQRTTEFYSRRFADQVHGAEKVDAAYAALNGEIVGGRLNGPEVIAQLRQSMDPFGDIMSWYQRHQALSEIGTDPTAYRERVRAELLAEMQKDGQSPAAAAPQASAQSRPAVIPSVNRAIGNAGAPQSTSITEDDIFNAAPAFGKRKS